LGNIIARPFQFEVTMSHEADSAKYPRTLHLPFTAHSTTDDKIMDEGDVEYLISERTVVTEKLDGSNVCLTSSEVFSRSHGGKPSHASFRPLIRFHERNAHRILSGYSIFAEWCYAVHSIRYEMLQHPLNVFGLRDDSTGEWLNWSDVVEAAEWIGCPTVPVILDGYFSNKEEFEDIITRFAHLNSVYGVEREGLVVRRFSGMEMHGEGKEKRLRGIGKWVRKNHVQTDEHWTRKPVDPQKTFHRV
jgi:hypothetical protein